MGSHSDPKVQQPIDQDALLAAKLREITARLPEAVQRQVNGTSGAWSTPRPMTSWPLTPRSPP